MSINCIKLRKPICYEHGLFSSVGLNGNTYRYRLRLYQYNLYIKEWLLYLKTSVADKCRMTMEDLWKESGMRKPKYYGENSIPVSVRPQQIPSALA